MHTAELRWLNEEDYLQGELTGQIRHEYVAGRIVAMVGVSKAHNVISANLLVLLRAHLRQSPYRVFYDGYESPYYPTIGLLLPRYRCYLRSA